MNAYLIDPFEKTLTEVEYNGDFREICRLIDAQVFDLARLPNGDAIYVDDEGLFKRNEFFKHKGYGNPLAGKGLVLGCDEQGDSTSPSCTLDELLDQVEFGIPIRVAGKVIWLPEKD